MGARALERGVTDRDNRGSGVEGPGGGILCVVFKFEIIHFEHIEACRRFKELLQMKVII